MIESARVVSFWYGEAYYRAAADTLRQDCEVLGLAAHICEAPLAAGTSWIDACRYKIRFLVECQQRFDEPLLWIDVDCRLLRRADELLRCTSDLGFFLRGFREIRDFDPVALPRFMQPSILAFAQTTKSRQFIALAGEIEHSHAAPATDDYFLQEAWRQFPDALTVTIASPQLVAVDDAAAGTAAFRFGRSGHAGAFKGQAQQHEIELFSPARRKALFMKEAQEAASRKDTAQEAFFLEKASLADPKDATLAHQLAGRWWRRGRRQQARALMTGRGVDVAEPDEAARFLVEMAIEEGQFAQALVLLSKLTGSTVAADRDWAGAMRLRAQIEQRAAWMCVPDRRRVALSWMEKPYPGNFGDILNPYVIERLTGIPPRKVPFGEGLLAIGSTIKFARAGGVVWGAGSARASDRIEPKADFRAVRGPLTRDLIIAAGGRCAPVYGDPAVLLPSIYRPARSAPRHRLGIVLHHAHRGRIACTPEVKVIDVLRSGYDGIERFIDELHDCEAILTTSLHGLIVSHAYGIPARWADVSGGGEGVPGDGMKFRDYLLSVGLPERPPVMLSPEQMVDDALRSLADELPARRIDEDALVRAAPFEIDRQRQPST